MKNPNLRIRVRLDGFRCLRCGNMWRPNGATANANKLPKKCPSCSSYFWNKPVVGRWPKKPA